MWYTIMWGVAFSAQAWLRMSCDRHVVRGKSRSKTWGPGQLAPPVRTRDAQWSATNGPFPPRTWKVKQTICVKWGWKVVFFSGDLWLLFRKKREVVMGGRKWPSPSGLHYRPWPCLVVKIWGEDHMDTQPSSPWDAIHTFLHVHTSCLSFHPSIRQFFCNNIWLLVNL